jgi:RNA methyltransferase, TrmH family
LFVLEAEDFSELDLKKKPEGSEVILPIGDPRNLGALARSALGFGINRIILTQEACHPFLPHSVKASAGAVLKIDFFIAGKKTNELPLTGDNFALDLNGENIKNQKWPKNFRLWLGEEGPGLRLDDSQRSQIKFITIPTEGIESLNASVSAAIAFWEIRKNV